MIKIKNILNKNKIKVEIYNKKRPAIHKTKLFEGKIEFSLPMTNNIYPKILFFSFHEQLNNRYINYIIKSLKKHG